MNNRTLVYTCCDNDYTHFIPLHCAAALFSNENIDIEIGVNLERLTDDEEEALNKLKNLHKDSKINIKYNFYVRNSSGGFNNATYNGKTMWSNTVRFVSEPQIKNKYTYIGDVDVILLRKNFYNYHINIMKEYGTTYSNWVRDNGPHCITGLHFVETDAFYPQKLDGINLNDVDEAILKIIQSRVCSINDNIPRRPVNGLHFSRNQRFKAQLGLCKTFIDELNSYKDNFFKFLNSEEYNIVKKCNTKLIDEYINEFTEYYNKLK